MKMKVITGIALTLFLASALTIAFNLLPVFAQIQVTTWVESFTVVPESVIIGQSVVVAARVRPPPSEWGYLYHGLQFRITKPDGSVVNSEPLTSNMDGAAEFNYVPDQIGTYFFQFYYPGEWLDPDVYATSCESTILTLIVREPPPPPPDLLVEDIIISPETPSAEEEVRIRAVITNIGGAPAEDILVLFMVNRQEFARETIGFLESGGQGVAEATWIATTPGDYTLYIEVDPEALIRESNEGNNIVEEMITVSRVVEPPRPPQDLSVFIWMVGGVAVAVGIGTLAVRLLKPKPEAKVKIKFHVKAQYYNMTISNDSEKGADNVEVSLEVSPPSFLAKVMVTSRIWERTVQVGSLGPGESKEIDFVTATVMPEIRVPVPISPGKPSVTVRYAVHGEEREYQLKPNEAVLTDDRILMRIKLQFDLDSEIAGLRKDLDTIRDIIIARKIRLPKALYNVLTVQNGSKAPISDIEVALDKPMTQILVGKGTFSMPVLGAGDVWRIRFGTIKPEFKALELLGKVRARMRYHLMGKSYDVELKTGEVMKTPENVITEIKVYDLEDRISLLGALHDEIRAHAKRYYSG